MIQAKRYHDISCGHRVVGHEGKCRNLHGHNYRVHFTVQADEVDGIGRVLDFSSIKSCLCEWLEEKWDHRMLIWCNDVQAQALCVLDPTVVILPFNPTAENLAKHLIEIGPGLLAFCKGNVRLVSVEIEETRKCSAVWTLD